MQASGESGGPADQAVRALVERVRNKDETLRQQVRLLQEKSSALQTQQEYSSRLNTRLVSPPSTALCAACNRTAITHCPQ